jgi:hypothetical protein
VSAVDSSLLEVPRECGPWRIDDQDFNEPEVRALADSPEYAPCSIKVVDALRPAIQRLADELNGRSLAGLHPVCWVRATADSSAHPTGWRLSPGLTATGREAPSIAQASPQCPIPPGSQTRHLAARQHPKFR